MTKKPIALVAVLVLSAPLAFSQGSYLKKGQTGFGLSGSYAANGAAHGFSGTAGAALGGIFDLAFSMGRAAYKPGSSLDFLDLEATSLVPEIRGHIIKQNSSASPVSVTISAGYARDSFSSPDLDAEGLEMWANSLLLGATVYRDVPLLNGLYLQPSAGISYTSTSVKFRDETGATLSGDDSLVSFGLGLPLVYAVSERALLVAVPSLTLDKDHTTFGVSVGLVYALSTAGRRAATS